LRLGHLSVDPGQIRLQEALYLVAKLLNSIHRAVERLKLLEKAVAQSVRQLRIVISDRVQRRDYVIHALKVSIGQAGLQSTQHGVACFILLLACDEAGSLQVSLDSLDHCCFDFCSCL
jgi:hypothetical protein